MTSPVLALAFTVLFVITGAGSLVRLVARAGADRTAELAHLAMSGAMAGMAWGWPAGPHTVGGTVQLLVFGVLAVVFAARVLDPAGPDGSAHHLLALAAMVWMVLGMSAAHGHGTHGAAAPAVTQLVTVAFVVAVCAAPFARATGVGQVLMSGGTAAMLLAML
ncbi:DUF5134 domain-containing protein [Pseudonocardia zijingensis]|uniref:DUF5134 domain-containing protein n=1 Tax=Pseudonocardia zijingensis TaxID=153376 RepID=A0ABP3YS78_9PSEU